MSKKLFRIAFFTVLILCLIFVSVEYVSRDDLLSKFIYIESAIIIAAICIFCICHEKYFFKD
jgi:high-affinity Fe2+/Pb2+ permease